MNCIKYRFDSWLELQLVCTFKNMKEQMEYYLVYVFRNEKGSEFILVSVNLILIVGFDDTNLLPLMRMGRKQR